MLQSLYSYLQFVIEQLEGADSFDLFDELILMKQLGYKYYKVPD